MPHAIEAFMDFAAEHEVPLHDGVAELEEDRRTLARQAPPVTVVSIPRHLLLSRGFIAFRFCPSSRTVRGYREQPKRLMPIG